MKYLLGFSAMFKKELIIMQRYFTNTIGGILTLYLVFLLIFLGYRGVAGGAANFGSGVSNIVVGYVTWFMLLIAYQNLPYTIIQEAQEGTLEQLYMSPLGFTVLGAFKFVSGILVEMIIVVILLLLAILTTGQSLNLDLSSIIPLIVIAITGVCGLGYMIGGLTLLFKRIQSYLQIIQFALIGLVAAPVTLTGVRWVPVALPSHWLRQVMVYGESLASIPANDWLAMLLSTLVFLAIGVVVFKQCETVARRRGIIGHF